MWSFKHQLRSKHGFSKRILALVDNLPLCLAANKGRGQSSFLKQPLREIAALSLVSNSRLHCRWIASEWNAADAPSRSFSLWAQRRLESWWKDRSSLHSNFHRPISIANQCQLDHHLGNHGLANVLHDSSIHFQPPPAHQQPHPNPWTKTCFEASGAELGHPSHKARQSDQGDGALRPSRVGFIPKAEVDSKTNSPEVHLPKTEECSVSSGCQVDLERCSQFGSVVQRKAGARQTEPFECRNKILCDKGSAPGRMQPLPRNPCLARLELGAASAPKAASPIGSPSAHIGPFAAASTAGHGHPKLSSSHQLSPAPRKHPAGMAASKAHLVLPVSGAGSQSFGERSPGRNKHFRRDCYRQS